MLYNIKQQIYKQLFFIKNVKMFFLQMMCLYSFPIRIYTKNGFVCKHSILSSAIV